MLDSVLVANEVVDEMKRKKKRWVIIKIDFEKAYDSVSWKFLYYMTARMGFCEKWVHWIKKCLESSSISILVNGSPTKEFKPSRGLRLGDPIAPFLFLIAAQGLSGLVNQVARKEVFSGLKVNTKNVEVKLLQFADDTFIMCESNIQNIIVIKVILRCFEIYFGLRINFFNSKIVVVESFFEVLHCSIMNIPFLYLGLPIGGKFYEFFFLGLDAYKG